MQVSARESAALLTVCAAVFAALLVGPAVGAATHLAEGPSQATDVPSQTTQVPSQAPQAPGPASHTPSWATGATSQTVGASSQTTGAPPCAVPSPSDYADPEGGTSGQLGWVDGYWHDEPLDLDTSDGLQADERHRLVARTAARVEVQRCLAFEELPPVEVQTREAFAEEIAADYEAESERVGDLMNAEAAAMLLIGHDRNWSDVQVEVLTGGVGAYYDPGTEEVTLIVESAGDRPREQILAHELVHALQDQHFDTVGTGASLRSQFDAERAVVEGDATIVQGEHSDRCTSGAWAGSCVQPANPAIPERPDDAGVLLLFEMPYYVGPAYVGDLRDDGGWDAVDERFDDLPDHSAYVVAPDDYEDVTVEPPTVEDRSTDDWERVTAEDRPNHDVVGQAALTAMFAAPALESDADGTVIELADLHDSVDGRFTDFDQPETSGWRGDRFLAYSGGERLASVWALEWVDAEQAERFAAAYRELLEIRGGEPVEGRSDAYRLDASTGYDSVYEVRVRGDRVTIVAAPTVEDVDAVHERRDDGIVPGFGASAAVVAALLAALLLARRR